MSKITKDELAKWEEWASAIATPCNEGETFPQFMLRLLAEREEMVKLIADGYATCCEGDPIMKCDWCRKAREYLDV